FHCLLEQFDSFIIVVFAVIVDVRHFGQGGGILGGVFCSLLQVSNCLIQLGATRIEFVDSCQLEVSLRIISLELDCTFQMFCGQLRLVIEVIGKSQLVL